MHRVSLAVLFASIAVSLGLADQPIKSTAPAPLPTPKAAELKPLDEVWEVAYVENPAGADVKIGHIHMTSVPVTADGKKLIRTTKELRFVVGRADAKAELKADMSTDEDADRKVHAVVARIWLGKDKVQTITGKIAGDQITRGRRGRYPAVPVGPEQRRPGRRAVAPPRPQGQGGRRVHLPLLRAADHPPGHGPRGRQGPGERGPARRRQAASCSRWSPARRRWPCRTAASSTCRSASSGPTRSATTRSRR